MKEWVVKARNAFVFPLQISYSMGMLKNITCVDMHLYDMLYVSYLIPVTRLERVIPASLLPAEAAPGKVFITLVIFRGKTSGAMMIPVPHIPFDQVNIRTYVIDPVTKKPAVYFIHCGISGAVITFLYRILSRMPVEHTNLSIHTVKESDGTYSLYELSGLWHGKFVIRAHERARHVDTLEPFSSRHEAMVYLIDPLVGFYDVGGTMRRLEIFHKPLDPRLCYVSEVEFPYLVNRSLVEADEILEPHNIMLVPYTPFRIYLPPATFH